MESRRILQLCLAAFIVACGRNEAVSQNDFWQKVPGLGGDTLFAVAINAAGTLLVGGNFGSGGIARSTDDGLTWRLSDSIGAGRFAFDAHGAAYAFGGPRAYRSADNGDNWTRITNPGGYPVWDAVITDSGHIFIGWGNEVGGGVERSTDNGASWVDVGLRANSYALAIDASGTLFSAGWKQNGPYIYRSTDNGSNWNSLAFYRSVTNLIISPTTGTMVVATSPGIFHSSDNGTHWVASRSGPLTSYVRCLAVNARGTIFVGTDDEGVWRSIDDGDTWTPVNTGLTNHQVMALAVNPQGTIFAATWGGLFRSVQPTATAVGERAFDAPMSFSLEQNYPNPFNPTTTIQYALPHRSHVTLTVFNTLGQKITELANGDIDAGYHEVKFDGTGLASGVYFYRLTAGNFVQTRKLLLIR